MLSVSGFSGIFCSGDLLWGSSKQPTGSAKNHFHNIFPGNIFFMEVEFLQMSKLDNHTYSSPVI